MRFIRLCIILNLIQLWVVQSEAHDGGFETIQSLERVCKNADSSDKIESMVCTGLCSGYFSGILQIRIFLFSILGQEPFPCLPKELTPNQASKIFLKWVEKNPESLHLHPIVGVFKSLGEAFECKPMEKFGHSQTSTIFSQNNVFSSLIKIIKFKKGESSTLINNSVIRGESDNYIFSASANQQLKIKIASLDENASVQIYEPGFEINTNEEGVFNIKVFNLVGKEEVKDSKEWSGMLNKEGNYLMVVGSTRGNAKYSLNIEIK